MNADQILERLLTTCFYRNDDGWIEWSFREGSGIREEDRELFEAINEWMKSRGIKTRHED